MNPNRRARDVGRPVNAFDENRELIAAEPRDRVGSPHTVAEPLTDRDQKLIAGGMAEGIVDVLEVIDVEQKHREGLAACALRRVERVRHTIEEQRAVRKSGQRIVKRIVDELALRFALLGDIASDAGRAENAVLGAAQHGVVPQNDSLFAVAREDLHFDVCPDHAASDVLEKAAAELIAPFSGDEKIEKVLPDHVLLCVAGHAHQIRVAVRDCADDVEQDRQQLDRVEHFAETPLRFPQRVFRPPDGVGVDGHREARAPARQPNFVGRHLDCDDVAGASL